MDSFKAENLISQVMNVNELHLPTVKDVYNSALAEHPQLAKFNQKK